MHPLLMELLTNYICTINHAMKWDKVGMDFSNFEYRRDSIQHILFFALFSGCIVTALNLMRLKNQSRLVYLLIGRTRRLGNLEMGRWLHADGKTRIPDLPVRRKSRCQLS